MEYTLTIKLAEDDLRDAGQILQEIGKHIEQELIEGCKYPVDWKLREDKPQK